MTAMHRFRRRATVAALLTVCSTAGAQVVRGTVVVEGSGAPVRGAVVTLLTPAGAEAGRRVLTDSDGSFAMRAPSAGSYIVEARAIGYAPRRTGARPVAAGETLVEKIVLRQVATRLATLRVEGRTACRRAGEMDAITTEVWDDVWAALAAAHLAREQRLVRAEVFVYTRELDVSTGLVMQEDRGVASVLDESPFRTAAPAELASRGFVQASLLGRALIPSAERARPAGCPGFPVDRRGIPPVAYPGVHVHGDQVAGPRGRRPARLHQAA